MNYADRLLHRDQ